MTAIPPRNIVLLAVLFEGGLVGVALVLGWLLGQDPRETLELTPAGVGWGVLATLPPLVLLWACLAAPWRPLVEVTQVVDQLIELLLRDCRRPAVAVVVISLLAGWGEEMLFRGVLQAAVAGRVGGPAGVWIGLIVAAAVFGLAHAITLTYAVLAAAIGLYFGWVWILSGNLLVPIVAHAAYDMVALVWLLKIRARRTAAGPPEVLQHEADTGAHDDGQDHQRTTDQAV